MYKLSSEKSNLSNGSDIINDYEYSTDISECSETSTDTSTCIEKIDIAIQTISSDSNICEIDIKNNIISSNVNTVTTKQNISKNIDCIDDDLAILNDPKVQNEEELIIFKEKYNDLTNENIKLKQDVIALKSSYDQLKNKSTFNLLIYLSPIIVLIAYIIISYL